jgi:hypothetical protein
MNRAFESGSATIDFVIMYVVLNFHFFYLVHNKLSFPDWNLLNSASLYKVIAASLSPRQPREE